MRKWSSYGKRAFLPCLVRTRLTPICPREKVKEFAEGIFSAWMTYAWGPPGLGTWT
jgi:hypothetical protein